MIKPGQIEFITMNNPIEILYEEHNIIIDAINIAHDLRKIIYNSDLYEKQANSLLIFFREFADKCHHQKEETVLFPQMIKANELLESGVVQEMFENHEDFRELINEIEKSIKNRDYKNAQNKLEEYTDALTDHIAVENEEVFEIAQTLFNENELEKIYYKFKDIDSEFGEKDKNLLQKQLNEIRSNLK